ncbi:hypothetical protein BDY17DRAFT_292981 [Neohortaea acidophila]|uniref:Uncharacterized protein n=1 Tax=Neohortaea acidophila TaxID=245834 RepID=A0A6A6PZC6_9PEZI|nr:uncharacterized protein BDY17DRAFT_292981 [Neohortaea acidophila]KAF2485126.1 hypothetical protein BDY17DRAFT_292981 [Neohortaea acidophila]
MPISINKQYPFPPHSVLRMKSLLRCSISRDTLSAPLWHYSFERRAWGRRLASPIFSFESFFNNCSSWCFFISMTFFLFDSQLSSFFPSLPGSHNCSSSSFHKCSSWCFFLASVPRCLMHNALLLMPLTCVARLKQCSKVHVFAGLVIFAVVKSQ